MPDIANMRVITASEWTTGCTRKTKQKLLNFPFELLLSSRILRSHCNCSLPLHCDKRWFNQTNVYLLLRPWAILQNRYIETILQFYNFHSNDWTNAMNVSSFPHKTHNSMCLFVRQLSMCVCVCGSVCVDNNYWTCQETSVFAISFNKLQAHLLYR